MKNETRKTAKENDLLTPVLNKKSFRLFRLVLISGLVLFLFSATLDAQDFPDEIRGYKVSKADVTVKNKNETNATNDKSEVMVKVSDPEMASISPTGITFEISAEIDALEQSGRVDFLTFKDFRVNNRAVDIEEYRNSFEFKKKERIILPEPVKVFLNSAQGLLGAASEITNSKEEWTVTGRIFVFGKFKKWGMKFKRVVPVDVNIKIKNPVKKERDGSILPF